MRQSNKCGSVRNGKIINLHLRLMEDGLGGGGGVGFILGGGGGGQGGGIIL